MKLVAFWLAANDLAQDITDLNHVVFAKAINQWQSVVFCVSTLPSSSDDPFS
ncbi:MAG: hypothetical protein RLY85_1379 [Bacteroidota bacterium]|jgi:hypothetical protein